MICKTGAGCGFRLPRPEIVAIQRDGSLEYANKCEDVIARLNPSIIVCVLARKVADRYATLMVFAMFDTFGMPSDRSVQEHLISMFVSWTEN